MEGGGETLASRLGVREAQVEAADEAAVLSPFFLRTRPFFLSRQLVTVHVSPYPLGFGPQLFVLFPRICPACVPPSVQLYSRRTREILLTARLASMI